jgi:hypothetical protein
MAASMTAAAQGAPPGAALPPVTVSGKASAEPVEKSYRAMVRGMDHFERMRPAMAPQATLRYKLLARRAGTNLDRIDLQVLGSTVEIPVPIAPDRTFTLERNDKAWAENARVTPDRVARTMTWRAEVRTPGLPPGTRRLGDLRLECQVGMTAGLISNASNAVTRLLDALVDTPAYCDRPDNRYLFFAERPLFGVTLVHGARREIIATDRLWASAVDERDMAAKLRACDCELLLDRTYFLPLDDKRWPDDTLVEFDFMEDGDAPAR